MYGFSLINHLGERFESCELECRDDECAIDRGRSFGDKGFPVEVRLGGQQIKLILPPSWQPEPWLRRLIE